MISSADKIAGASGVISLIALGVSLAPYTWRRSHRPRLSMKAGNCEPFVLPTTDSYGKAAGQIRVQVCAQGRWQAEGVRARLERLEIRYPPACDWVDLYVDPTPLRWSTAMPTSTTSVDNFSTSISPSSFAYANLAVWNDEKQILQIENMRDDVHLAMQYPGDREYRLSVSVTADGLNSVAEVIAISLGVTPEVKLEAKHAGAKRRPAT